MMKPTLPCFEAPAIARLFSASEREWIERYHQALDELVDGTRSPRTEGQRTFLAVAKGLSEPTTNSDRLWLRFTFVRETFARQEELAHLKEAIEEISKTNVESLIGLLGPELAASLGHPSILRFCADHYSRGNSYDPEKALPLARRAAELGDGEAAQLLGLMHEYGLGCSENREAAMSWYKLAAERGVEAAKEKVKTLVIPDHTKLRVAVGDGTSRAWPRGSGYDNWARDDLSTAAWESIMGGPDYD